MTFGQLIVSKNKLRVTLFYLGIKLISLQKLTLPQSPRLLQRGLQLHIKPWQFALLDALALK